MSVMFAIDDMKDVLVTMIREENYDADELAQVYCTLTGRHSDNAFDNQYTVNEDAETVTFND